MDSGMIGTDIGVMHNTFPQYFPVHWSMESSMKHVMKSVFATALLIITGIPAVSAAADPLMSQAQKLLQPIPETASSMKGVPMTAEMQDPLCRDWIPGKRIRNHIFPVNQRPLPLIPGGERLNGLLPAGRPTSFI